jgi:hypothetical protein
MHVGTPILDPKLDGDLRSRAGPKVPSKDRTDGPTRHRSIEANASLVEGVDVTAQHGFGARYGALDLASVERRVSSKCVGAAASNRASYLTSISSGPHKGSGTHEIFGVHTIATLSLTEPLADL